MSMHSSRSLAQVERAGPAFISALGVVTAAVSVSHIFAIGEPVFGIVFSAITTSLGLGLVYSGYWLSARSDIDTRHYGQIALLTLGGIVLILVVLGLMVFYQLAEGATIEDPIFFVGGTSTIGGVSGFLVGVSNARQVRAEQVVAEKEKIELLNQVLRHNILNATNILNGRAQLLQNHVDDDGQAYLDTVLTWNGRISELTQKVRTIIEEVQNGDVALRPVDLHAILDDELAKLRETHEDVTITVEENSGEAAVRADEMLVEIFENLLDNAIRHNDADKPELHVSVDTTDGSVVTSVADNGPGLSKDVRTALLNGASSDFQDSGVGLGLYLVSRFVDRYDGDIQVTDRDPHGTIIEVELPQA